MSKHFGSFEQARYVLPVAAAGALLLTGCSAGSAEHLPEDHVSASQNSVSFFDLPSGPCQGVQAPTGEATKDEAAARDCLDFEHNGTVLVVDFGESDYGSLATNTINETDPLAVASKGLLNINFRYIHATPEARAALIGKDCIPVDYATHSVSALADQNMPEVTSTKGVVVGMTDLPACDGWTGGMRWDGRHIDVFDVDNATIPEIVRRTIHEVGHEVGIQHFGHITTTLPEGYKSDISALNLMPGEEPFDLGAYVRESEFSEYSTTNGNLMDRMPAEAYSLNPAQMQTLLEPAVRLGQVPSHELDANNQPVTIDKDAIEAGSYASISIPPLEVRDHKVMERTKHKGPVRFYNLMFFPQISEADGSIYGVEIGAATAERFVASLGTVGSVSQDQGFGFRVGDKSFNLLITDRFIRVTPG